MNIGIDFGSTYTTISTYKNDTDTPEALRLDTSQPDSIPSIVCIDKFSGSEFTGYAAKEEISADNTDISVYRAFKMLLTENNPKELEKHGYDSKHTPRMIATKFLKAILTGIQRRYMKEDEQFENIYICVPEIWESKIIETDGRNISRALDGKMILWDILTKNIDLPIRQEGVHVVTEPEAASAYFAHNYEKETGKKFNGHLLLIDYGGGTLDLTLTEVKSIESGSMEITRRANGGAGENHRDQEGHPQIGNAGIAFQRTVLTYAFIDAGIWTAEDQPGRDSIKFAAAEKSIESILKDPFKQEYIEAEFDGYGNYRDIASILEDEPMLFPSAEQPAVIKFNGKRCTFTYQHLYRAYRDTIEKVLYAETKRICERTSQLLGYDPCCPETGNNDRFKIALVGGFGSFHLVKKQIAEIFNLNSDTSRDFRVKSINTDKRELAISLGASLLAEGKVTLHKTARFSIGIVSRTHDGKLSVRYGIKCDQELETNTPYFILHDNQNDRQPYGGALSEYIREFVIEDSNNLRHGYLMPIKPVLQQKLSVVPDVGFWNIGFSLNENDVITLHVVHAQGKREPIVIPLDSYDDLFEFSEPRQIEQKDGEWIIK